LSFRLESPIHAPKSSVFGGFTSKFRDISFGRSKGTSLSGTTRFQPSLVHVRTVRPVALAKKTKQEVKVI